MPQNRLTNLNDEQLAVFTDEAAKIWPLLSRFLNNFNYKYHIAAMLKQLNREHPTLQQNFWRMVFGLIQEYAQTESYDARNERSVEVCRKISEFMEDDYLWQLPTI